MKHVYANDVIDWFVAESEEHAAELWRDYLRNTVGDNREDYEGEGYTDFVQEPDDRVLRVRLDDSWSEPVAKTCREWADDSDCGFLCSTEY